MELEFVKLEQKYVPDLVKLFLQEYEQECRRNQALTQTHGLFDVTELVENLVTYGIGMVAIKEGCPVGYLGFFGPWEQFHGNVKGVFSPLGGSAFADKEQSGVEKEKLVSMLFAAVSQRLVEEQVFSVAICRWAHDEASGRALVLNGMGIRCADAIRVIDASEHQEPIMEEICFCELAREEYRQIDALRQGLVQHLSKAPTFFPTDLQRYDTWFENNDMRVFVAKENDRVVGFISVEEEGETIISECEDVANICGAYVAKEYRGGGLAQKLLAYVSQRLGESGKLLLGVDCETLNPTALHFWGKYFEPYTYSYARRFDERIGGYGEYMSGYFGEVRS